MSGLRERLGRLRSGAPEVTTRDERSAAADTIDSRTDATALSQPIVVESTATSSSLSPEFLKIGVQLHDNEAGHFLLRKVEYSFPHRHGRYDLAQLLTYAPYLHPIALRQNRQSSVGNIDPYQMLFLDTETTGLGIGAGNVPFMIGFGYCTDKAFVVEQALIRHPGEESAMLTYLLGHMKDKTHLVTYNGRTFDWPVLVNRFILNGWRQSGQEPSHLDFLHPSRALWRNTLPSCRLSIVEEARLGINRGEDVPGSLAPELYFRYLADGHASHLHGVYAHNEKDILTLASLSVHFGQLLSGRLEAGVSSEAEGEELFRTACWLEQHHNQEAAQRLFAQLDEMEDVSESAGWSLALAARYKRAGQHERALPIWRRAAAKAERSMVPKLDAHVELAIYYEHRDKQLLIALTYAEKALELTFRRAKLVSDATKRQEEKDALRHRIARLKHKVSRERK